MKKRSVLSSWFFSYAVLFFLPLVISLFAYVTTAAVLEKRMRQSNQAALSLVGNQISEKLRSLQRLTWDIGGNPLVAYLVDTQNSGDPEYRYNLLSASHDLGSYAAYNPTAITFFVHLLDAEEVVLPDNAYPAPFYYATFFADGAKNYQTLVSPLQQVAYLKADPVVRLDDRGHRHQALRLVTSLPFHSSDRPRASLVILLDVDELLGILKAADWGTSQTAILDADDQVLVSTSTLPGVRTGTEHFSRFERPMAAFGWKILLVVPDAFLWRDLDLVRWVIAAAVLVSLFLGGILIYCLVRWNYNPISSLVQKISGRHGVPWDAKNDEFGFIQEAVDASFTQNQQSQVWIERNRERLAQGFLLRLLRGTAEETVPLEESMKAYDLRFVYQGFAVVVMEPSIHDRRSFPTIWQQACGNQADLFVPDADALVPLLINLPLESSEIRQSQLQEWVDRFSPGLRSGDSPTLLGVSSVGAGVDEIPELYRQAQLALDYRLVAGGRETTYYSDIAALVSERRDRGYWYPEHLEQSLVNVIRTGDEHLAFSRLKTLGEKNAGIVGTPMFHYLVLHVAGSLARALEQFVPFSRFSRDDRSLDWDDLALMVKEACASAKSTLSERQTKHKNEQSSQLAEQISAFITERHSDVNLNVNAIAERFSITPGYLSRLYKDETGEGILDLLNRTRIENAKRLLKRPDLNLNQVSAEVGFGEINTFIRVFKRHEGVTPGKFRESAG